MPIYEYRCDDCGATLEVLQKMSDDPLVTCEECGGTLRKVLHPVAIHFKGSGFYTTDYGKGSGRRTGGGDDASASGDAASSSSDGAASGEAGKGEAGKGAAAKADASKGAAGADKPAKAGGASKGRQKAT